ncbi:hypothetical protein AK812_SmicGene859 [Symbiodinium microadriaticum]|uniref:Uncharacterized protein n=1 Tax=Symbiodinium microadriaticum TaxID=2951 RepID=A0A1Q9F5P0_SYMMI|nr:hypothetical protein AK812_SmicGene859 [Symbiodinium microadriaticum]
MILTFTSFMTMTSVIVMVSGSSTSSFSVNTSSRRILIVILSIMIAIMAFITIITWHVLRLFGRGADLQLDTAHGCVDLGWSKRAAFVRHPQLLRLAGQPTSEEAVVPQSDERFGPVPLGSVLQNASQNKPNEQLQTTTCLEQEAQNAADPSVPPLPLQDALHDQ